MPVPLQLQLRGFHLPPSTHLPSQDRPPHSSTPPNEFPLSCSSTQAPRTRPWDPFPALGSPRFSPLHHPGTLETVLLPRSPRTAFFRFPPSKRSETPRVPAVATSSPYSGPIPARSLSPLAGPKSPRRPLSHQEPIGLHLQPAPGRDGGGRPSGPAELFAHSHTSSSNSPRHPRLSSPGPRLAPRPLSGTRRPVPHSHSHCQPVLGPSAPSPGRPGSEPRAAGRPGAPRNPLGRPRTPAPGRSRPPPPPRPSRRPLLQDGGSGGGGGG